MVSVASKVASKTMPMLKLTEKTLSQDWLGPDHDRLVIRDEDLPGFIATVGKSRTTFGVDYRFRGKRRLVTIGVHGWPMPDSGDTWNVTRARLKAKELLGQVAGGVDPSDPIRAKRGGPTLRDGLDLHVKNMAKLRCSPRSIETMQGDIRRHMAEWLDRPITDLGGAELNRIHDSIKAKAIRRTGANEANPPGASLANRIIRHVSAIWNTLDQQEPFEGRNPTVAVVHDDVLPRGTRVNDPDFGGWFADMQKMDNPIRRDMQLLAMLTAPRSGSVRQVRWPDVDWRARVLTFAFAKGGKPYAVPLGLRALELLAWRERDNAEEFEPWGGDHGFVFPSFARAKDAQGRLVVQAVAGAHERRHVKVDGKYKKVRAMPPIHDLRRTYNSVAIEIGIPKEARHMLLNHERQGVNVKHYGFPQNWTYLAECQQKIEDAIWERLTRPSCSS